MTRKPEKCEMRFSKKQETPPSTFILKLAFAIAATNESGDALSVGDVCNLEAYVTEYSTPIDQVLMTLAEHRIGSALVTRNGKLVGILTNTDVYRCYAELLKIAYPDA